METKTLDKHKINQVVNYTCFMISEFSEANKIGMTESFDYLKKYGGLDFLREFYDVEHCENPALTLESLQQICTRNGGKLHYDTVSRH
jgi:hypothetical protein